VTQHRLIIGAYTEHMPFVDGKADGVLGATYDPAAGTAATAASIGAVTVLARMRNPSYVALSADGRHLYAVNETAEFEGQPGGGVTAFARDPEAGTLRQLNVRSSAGEAPAHLALSQDGRFLLVANYDSGSLTAIVIEPDGSLGAQHAHVQHAGSSVNPQRQAGPHVHMVCPVPGTHDVLVTDLGMDAVMTYELTDAGLTERPGTRFAAPPGTGPRHIVLHPDGRHVFVVGELSSTVLTLRREGGLLVLADVEPTLPPGFSGSSLAGAIRLTPDGQFVLASNRGHDSIAMLRFDAADSALALVHVQSASGRGPRDFCLTPEGDRLIVANQDSDNLVVMDLDEATPQLRPVSAAAAPTPSCVLVAR
jgi:6-phosphogluconolactonase